MATKQLGTGEHLQKIILVDSTGANIGSIDASGRVSVTIADGQNVTIGSKSDSAWDGAAASPSLQAVAKALYSRINATGQSRTLLFKSIDVNTNGDNTIIAAAASLKTKVVSYVLVATGAVSVKWFSGAAGTALSGAMPLAANGSGLVVVGEPTSHLMETAVNTALVLNLSTGTAVRGHMAYFQEA